MLIPTNLDDVVLGQEYEREGKKFRVVRIVRNQLSLYNGVGGLIVQEESFIQLRNSDGGVDFEPYLSRTTDYAGPLSDIKTYNQITWRRA